VAIVKAGSEQSTPNPYNVIPSPKPGDVLTHDSGKTISHVILCTDTPSQVPVGTLGAVGLTGLLGAVSFAWYRRRGSATA